MQPSPKPQTAAAQGASSFEFFLSMVPMMSIKVGERQQNVRAARGLEGIYVPPLSFMLNPPRADRDTAQHQRGKEHGTTTG